MIKNRIIDEYSYKYLCNIGKACGRTCISLKEYQFYKNSKKWISCSNCDKPTTFACDWCPFYIRDYYVIQYYNRL